MAVAPDGSVWNLCTPEQPRASLQVLTSGDYVVSLTVVDANGNFSVLDYVTIHAADNLPPVAIATADKSSGVAPLTVCFDGSQSYDPEGSALGYYWGFGDYRNPNPIATTPTACYTYQPDVPF